MSFGSDELEKGMDKTESPPVIGKGGSIQINSLQKLPTQGERRLNASQIDNLPGSPRMRAGHHLNQSHVSKPHMTKEM